MQLKIVGLGLFYLLLVVLGSGRQLLMHQQYAFLADSLIRGRVDFLEEPTVRPVGEWTDTVYWNGVYYWPNGVLPGLLLTAPVALFGKPGWLPYQWTLMTGLVGIGIVLGYVVFRKLGYSPSGVGYLLFGFFVGSAFMGVVQEPSSYYLAHVVVVVGWLLVLAEVVGRRRWWVLGLGLVLIGMTRTTALLPAVFLFLLPRVSKKHLLGVGVGLLVFLAGYNFFRFGSVFEFGYRMQILTNPTLLSARSIGLFSLQHIPANVYYAFVAGYVPVGRTLDEVTLRYPFITYSYWGLGLLYTSPYLLWLGRRLIRSFRDDWTMWLGIGGCMLVLFGYYGIGWTQFGYRYGLDYFPVLFFVFAKTYRREHLSLSREMKVVLIGSGLLNVYLLMTRGLAGH